MPDPDILNALSTESPTPEFIADTRQILSAAWHQPTSSGAASTGATPQGTIDMNTSVPHPPSPTDRHVNHSPSPRSRRPGPRWIASAAAAALVVVGGVLLVNYNKRGDGRIPAPATYPLTTATSTLAEPAATNITTTVPPTAPPPSTNATPATTPTIPDPADAPTVKPTDATTPAPQTTPAPSTTPTYVAVPGPQWANVAATAPVANFPDDGVYATAIDPQINGDTVTFTLVQFLTGDACNTYYSVPVDQYTDECAGGYTTIDTPTASVVMDSSAMVIADFSQNENIATYQIPPSEFIRFLNDPAAPAPDGLEFWGGPVFVRVQSGKVSAVRSLAWS